jgi:probable F420-dependent oxidoreductase
MQTKGARGHAMVEIGFLLPTREQIIRDQDEARSLIRLAEKAEDLGFDSVWVGDSTLARPRHEPLTLLSAVAGRTTRAKLGTAVLIVPQRNPVLLAHQIATLDQISEGRVIFGVGFSIDVPNVRAEFVAMGAPFEKRVGRMLEAIRVCQALWRGEDVNWEGRWKLEGANLRPKPFQAGGPPIWGGGSAEPSLVRAGKYFDGWMPTGPDDPNTWASHWDTVKTNARQAGRQPGTLTGALYATITVADDAETGEARLMDYLRSYYGSVAEIMRAQDACYGGPIDGLGPWLQGFVDAGVQHIVLRFAGDHDLQMEGVSRLRQDLDW